MPFTYSKLFNLKILLDTGASANIMNPDVTFDKFPNHIYPYDFDITACNKTYKGHLALSIPIFKEHDVQQEITFLVFPWHKNYNCLISYNDLSKLKCSRDLENKTLNFKNKPRRSK